MGLSIDKRVPHPAVIIITKRVPPVPQPCRRFNPTKMGSHNFLVGGFNPFEKYLSNWKSSPSRDENQKYLKPPPSFGL